MRKKVGPRLPYWGSDWIQFDVLVARLGYKDPKFLGARNLWGWDGGATSLPEKYRIRQWMWTRPVGEFGAMMRCGPPEFVPYRWAVRLTRKKRR